MTDMLLEIRNLNIEFTTENGIVHAVKDLSLSIPRGETTGLVGESGSGKSVTSLAIMGLIQGPPGIIKSGEIIYNGEDLTKLSDDQMRKIRGNKISMIFQEPMTSLNPVYTVGSQIDEAIMLHQNLNKTQARKKTIALLEEVGIKNAKEKSDAYPHQMSGGQKQRVMIAMAISSEPDLLICDEPTTALDVTIQKQVLELMRNLQSKRGMSILFITHDLAVMGEISGHVAVMYKGNLVENNTTKNLFMNPKHPYTKGLLACRPGLDTNPRRLLTVDDFLDTDKIKNNPLKTEIKKPRPVNEIKNPVILELKNLKKYYDAKTNFFGKTVEYFRAVENINISVRKGRTFGLVGESGCGKTTLGRSILRLLEPTSGSVIYNGEDITHIKLKRMRKLRKKMQIIFQDPYSSLNPRMTIGNIITEPMDIHNIGSSKEERLSMASELLEKVGLLPEHLGRYPHEFSGGQRQRICIARALGLRPEFIICDESVSALDVSVQAQVLNLLQDLQDEFGLTYIFISHDLSVVKYISDEIAVMHRGEIIEYGSAEEIYKNPKMQYTKRLLDSIPQGL